MVKPSKSRKEMFQSEAHIRSKAIACHLNKKLRQEVGKRSLPIKKNDVVEIVRGNFKGKEGKVLRVNRKERKIFIEKIIRKKSDGTEYNVAIDSSNVIIVTLERGDRKRLKQKGKKKEETEAKK